MTFSTRIHPADEMHRFELAAPHRTAVAADLLYFATGRQIFEAVAGVVAWRFRGFGGAQSFFCTSGGAALATAPQRIPTDSAAAVTRTHPLT